MPLPKDVVEHAASSPAKPSIDTEVFDLTDKGDRAHLDALMSLGEYDEPRYIR